MRTQTLTTHSVTLIGAMKAGLIAGCITAVLNLVWYYIATAMGSVPPPAFIAPIIFSSIIPVLVGAALYYVLVRFTTKGKMIWIILATVFALVSLFPTFATSLPDGSPVPTGFTLLTLPMHLITGLVAIFIIPRFSR
jgi:hypothetical protein